MWFRCCIACCVIADLVLRARVCPSTIAAACNQHLRPSPSLRQQTTYPQPFSLPPTLPPPSSLNSTPSPNARIKPHQPLRPNPIPIPNQPRQIQIQRTIHLPPARQQELHGFQRRHETVSRRPGGRREEVQADFAGAEGDVGVAAGGAEGYCWWEVGVGWWEGEGECEEAAWEGGC